MLSAPAPGLLATGPSPDWPIFDDDDGDKISLVLADPPTSGQLTLNTAAGSFEYWPNWQFVGDVSFTVRAQDTSGALSAGKVNVTIHVVGEYPVLSCPV